LTVSKLLCKGTIFFAIIQIIILALRPQLNKLGKFA